MRKNITITWANEKGGIGTTYGLKTSNRGKAGRQQNVTKTASYLYTISYGCLQNDLELKN